jgi:L-threonylcarbamoyladenylate synthase
MEKDSILSSFLEKNKTLLVKGFSQDYIRASILTTSEEDLDKAGKLIAAGELVSFPTETVYGLGANALDESAVLKIYKAKSKIKINNNRCLAYHLFYFFSDRPLTDPVIVHVTSYEQAADLVEISGNTNDLFKFLVDSFWPGPLTLILKADLKKIPLCVTAQTGYVGVRWPKSEVKNPLNKISIRIN